MTVQEGAGEALGPGRRVPGSRRGGRGLASQWGAEPDRECLGRKGGQRALYVVCLPHPTDKSPSHQATLSVRGPRGVSVLLKPTLSLSCGLGENFFSP